MGWTLCTSEAAIAKAGANANSDVTASTATLLRWCNECEGRICAETRKDYLTNYSSMPTGIQYVLNDICSSLIAQKIVAYDPTGYLSREADLLMNINDEIINKGITVLKDFKTDTLQTPETSD